MLELMIIAVCLFVFILGIAAFGGSGGSWTADPKTIKRYAGWVKYADGNPTVVWDAFKDNPKTEDELKTNIDKILNRQPTPTIDTTKEPKT